MSKIEKKLIFRAGGLFDRGALDEKKMKSVRFLKGKMKGV